MNTLTLANLSLILRIGGTLCVTQRSLMFPISSTLKNSLMGSIQDSADFAIKIHPPKQETNEILEDIDEIKSLEMKELNYEMEDYARAKQKMLNLHKRRIEQIVSKAFEPLHATLVY
ncbi:secreted ookinete protein, putative (PSOP6) [Babesia microti strain RI]|uniref:Secreted ookinete protein, putative (PSOP6) n=1 Tax=Babesia microti (strain RI) TaxID=1133968 RepID=A0A1N6LXS5_BABMR|nr:secreted ookinete protein, putative (PSOP6) [Babesia microti strain RI]SIO73680.1 secreted ookinete protein, putative (PSOP6) [Babesia microti strain RI]|eukprot:XP_021337750.1 secreted ookinete protein, putative (PSOP6) [Babesia microti strain RI]